MTTTNTTTRPNYLMTRPTSRLKPATILAVTTEPPARFMRGEQLPKIAIGSSVLVRSRSEGAVRRAAGVADEVWEGAIVTDRRRRDGRTLRYVYEVRYETGEWFGPITAGDILVHAINGEWAPIYADRLDKNDVLSVATRNAYLDRLDTADALEQAIASPELARDLAAARGEPTAAND